MSQPIFKNPIVSAGPTRTGTGSGTLTVDKLTHFTISQDYTATCIATSPDTVFSITGSLDGAIGIATVATQFFDNDLKVFLTIQQGSTPFIVGDQFVVSVTQGTDVTQENIDSYDELPQKNFGLGVKGFSRGDNNIRYSDNAIAADLFLQSLKLVAVTAGTTGNLITLELREHLAPVAAHITILDLTFTAVTAGAAGNAITIEYTDGATAGMEIASVTGTAITVQIANGDSSATQVKAALDAVPAITALINTTISGTASAPQAAPTGPTNLAGGVDAIGLAGSESVSVTGNAILVYMQNGLSTQGQVAAALQASSPALALVTTTLNGLGTDLAYVEGPKNLTGGLSRYFAFNEHELSDAMNFEEGNASIKVRDLIVTGEMVHDGHEEHTGVLALADSDSTNQSGDAIPNVQAYLNYLIQDGKMSLRTSDASVVSWSKPTFFFTADILINFNDTGFTNRIEAANSPFGPIADGQSVYVILNRRADAILIPVIANSVPTDIAAFRLLTRFGDNIILWDNSLIRDGKSARIGEGGGDGGGTLHVDLIDPVSTTLPTGMTATVDGVTLVDNMLVLFTALTTGANEVYKVSGVGTSISFASQVVWSNGLTPAQGEQVVVDKGVAYAEAEGIFDGTGFLFNDRVRYYTGADYLEVSSLKTATFADNTTAAFATFAWLGSENIKIDFSILRGALKEIGTVYITTDGSSASVVSVNGVLSDTGVTFNAGISGSNISLMYTSTSTGAGGTIKYQMTRWSNAPGGPAGIPSYSGGSGSGLLAAGAPGDVQYNSGGNLAGDTAFSYDDANKILTINGLQMSGLQGPVTLVDNVTTPAVALSYNATLYHFAIFEFSIVRGSAYQMGFIQIVNDGTTTSIILDADMTADPGIEFGARITSGNVELTYTSTATGSNATFKYNFRRWA